MFLEAVKVCGPKCPRISLQSLGTELEQVTPTTSIEQQHMADRNGQCSMLFASTSQACFGQVTHKGVLWLHVSVHDAVPKQHCQSGMAVLFLVRIMAGHAR